MTTGGGLFGGNSLFGDNLINAFEESDLGRQGLFQSFAPRGLPQLQQAQFGTLYQPTFNSYLGDLGRQIRQGQIPGPDQTFTNFLETNPSFNAQRSLLQLPDISFGQSGLGPNIFNFGGR